jgi:predicted TIM-barrel fold metal-dependent hydrolase
MTDSANAVQEWERCVNSDRMMIVSLDCHIDAESPRTFQPYVETRFQEDFEAWASGVEQAPNFDELLEGQLAKDYMSVRGKATTEFFERMGYDEETYRKRVYSTMSMTGDPSVRLKELEADGIVAEILFPNGLAPMGSASFASAEASDDPRRREVVRAGVMAYNRWIADICQAHPGRRVGTAILPAIYDVDDVVGIMTWAKEAGIGAVTCPSPMVSGLPPLWDDYYEPIWAAAANLDLPLQCHLGWGGAPFTESLVPGVVGGSGAGMGDRMTRLMIKSEAYFFSRRALWILTWSGAFDRYPNLKLMFVEQLADWVPNTLRFLDSVNGRHNQLGTDEMSKGHVLQRKPSEYWVDHCMVAASFISRGEVAMRDEIGINNLAFGTDYPHPEATWPTTRAWLNGAFSGQDVSEQDARMILGQNAVRFYNLDQAQLQAVANEVGPTVDEVLVPAHTVSPELQAWMESRELNRQVASV